MVVQIVRMMSVVVGLGMIGCGEEKAPGPKSPKQAAQASGDQAANPAGVGSTPVEASSQPVRLRIAPASGSGTTFTFDRFDAISIAFAVSGDQGHAVGIALLDAPAGATLLGASSSQPTFSWPTPRQGTHSFRFLLRDMDACQAEEGSLSACALDESATEATQSYDTSSGRFIVEVGSNTDISSNGGTGGGTGDMIAQILQGFGGGGDLQGLLQGLSSGQLQQILQGQTSGLDIASLIQLISGFGLTNTTFADGDEG